MRAPFWDCNLAIQIVLVDLETLLCLGVYYPRLSSAVHAENLRGLDMNEISSSGNTEGCTIIIARRAAQRGGCWALFLIPPASLSPQ